MTHIFPVRVYYEDTDMAGIVYHANYLRYIERARSDWVRAAGIDQNAMRESGLVFVVSRLEADYLRPARFDDRLEVVTTLEKLSRVRMVFRQKVLRGEEILFDSRVTATCMDRSGRVRRLPEGLGAPAAGGGGASEDG